MWRVPQGAARNVEAAARRIAEPRPSQRVNAQAGVHERNGITLAALSIAIEQARRQTATRANRERQRRAELRLEEIVKVAGIADGYARGDRDGNLLIEQTFAKLYQAVDSPMEREAVVQAFMVWQADERHESSMVRALADDSVAFLKRNNPVWIDGAAVPADSDGAA